MKEKCKSGLSDALIIQICGRCGKCVSFIIRTIPEIGDIRPAFSVLSGFISITSRWLFGWIYNIIISDFVLNTVLRAKSEFLRWMEYQIIIYAQI